MNESVPYFKLFTTFFKIGGFTFGGGYAMLPLIQAEIVDKHHWMEQKDFLDLFAMSQSLPGVFAVNISIFTGYKLRGFKGAFLAALGTTLPSFLIILSIAIFFAQFNQNPVVERIFKGIRPVVIAMIAAPVFVMWKTMKMKNTAVWIPALSALLVWLLGISPIIIIIAGAIGGLIYTFYIQHKINRV